MTAALAMLQLPNACTFASRDDIRDRALQAIEARRSAGADVFVIDGSQVQVFDAAALGLLVLLEKRAREAGLRLVVHAPTPVMLTVLRAAGLDHDLLIDRTPP